MFVVPFHVEPWRIETTQVGDYCGNGATEIVCVPVKTCFANAIYVVRVHQTVGQSE